MDSIWVKEANKPRFSLLEGNRNTEVLIVGGGIAGILCAYRLKNAGVDCVLTEQNEICGGVTQNTTAKITFAHGLIYNRIKNRYGINTAKKYLSAQVKACGEYARIVGEIDCGYEKKDSYVYSLSGRKKIEDEITALNSIGIKAEFSETPSIPVKTEGAVLVRDQAQFQPLKFLFELAKDLPIWSEQGGNGKRGDSVQKADHRNALSDSKQAWALPAEALSAQVVCDRTERRAGR